MGALSLTGDWRRPPLEPGIPGVVRAEDCYCDRCPFGKRVETCARECASHIGDLLRDGGAAAGRRRVPRAGAGCERRARAAARVLADRAQGV